MGLIEVKIKKLDGELARYKEQMSKLRNSPGKVRVNAKVGTLEQVLTRYAWVVIHRVQFRSVRCVL